MSNQIAGWKKVLIGFSIIAAVAIGFWIGRQTGPEEAVVNSASESTDETETTEVGAEESGPKWWTCSMHPSVKLPSGDMKCPICFMELIPMEEGSEEGEIPSLKLSERARFLAEVETAEVLRREVTKEVRLVGKIQPDETHLSVITARVPGRLERLFVDYTGMEVREGDHLVELYSPELFSAQQELLQAIRSSSDLEGARSNLLVDAGKTLIQSAKSKLIRLGLTEKQVEEIVESGEATDTLTVYSPTSGIVTARQGTEGMYVDEGTMIYTIADLTEVWLLLEAYESDIKWLHYGQSVHFETEAYPGEWFSGTLSFISPVLDERSRTVTLRVNVPNEDLRLKPGMFARAHIHAIPSAGGKVMAPEMEGKWLCPMHPEVVEDFFGFCPICEMPLETAKSLGYVAASEKQNLPLVVPDTAPLITGKRAIVYVEEKSEEELRYAGREILLGPHAGGHYVVEAGLEEGERVVVKGNFKIDSALQLQGKPSMMNPEGIPGPPDESETATEDLKKGFDPVEIPEEFREKVRPVVKSYLDLQTALAADSFEEAQAASVRLATAVESLSEKHLAGDSHDQWMADLKSLSQTATSTKDSPDMEKMRESFYPLSQDLEDFVLHFGHGLDFPIRRAFCPMALEDGATWIQVDETIANPYYGASMLRCGEIQATYPGQMAEGGGGE